MPRVSQFRRQRVKNAFQANLRGCGDTTISKLTATGELIFATYFGSPGWDKGSGVLAKDGSLIPSGITSSTSYLTRRRSEIGVLSGPLLNRDVMDTGGTNRPLIYPPSSRLVERQGFCPFLPHARPKRTWFAAPVKGYTPVAILDQCAYAIVRPGPRTSNGSSILTRPSVGKS